MPASFQVRAQKQHRFAELAIGHQEMVKVGTVGIATIKNRVHAGLGPDDSPAKPLSPKYLAIKRNMGGRPIRDLFAHGKDFRGTLQRAKKRGAVSGKVIGHMLHNLQVISVRINSVKIGLTTYAARIKGRANQLRQPWLIHSRRDRANTGEAFRQVVAETKLLVLKKT